jgi:c-di-GMP-binding flagellar brake protein YcgR
MKTTGKPKKKKAQLEIATNRRREWRLELPLRTTIEGNLPQGAKFKEATTIENISATGAYFCLDSGLIVGSKLNLMIDLPDELTGGKDVKLSLGGITVRLEEPDKKGKKQGVAIRFNKDFQFIESGKKKRPR